jgi:hypothetical protein
MRNLVVLSVVLLLTSSVRADQSTADKQKDLAAAKERLAAAKQKLAAAKLEQERLTAQVKALLEATSLPAEQVKAINKALETGSSTQLQAVIDLLSADTDKLRKRTAVLNACADKLQHIADSSVTKEQMKQAVEAMRHGSEADRACVQLADKSSTPPPAQK